MSHQSITDVIHPRIVATQCFVFGRDRAAGGTDPDQEAAAAVNEVRRAPRGGQCRTEATNSICGCLKANVFGLVAR
jgi:hypothetical protein